MINWCRCQLVDGTTLPPLSVGLLAKGHTTYLFYTTAWLTGMGYLE